MSAKTLQSWKEISKFLRRGVRTAQRWERLGMPVHRPAGRGRSAVFAMEYEIADWMQRTATGCIAADPQLEVVQRVKDLEAENAALRHQLNELAKQLPCQLINGAARKIAAVGAFMTALLTCDAIYSLLVLSPA